LHARAPLDVLWFPFNGCSWTNFTLPAVATLHDASNFVLPDTMPEMQRLFHAAAERCRFLITDSVFSQHELARELHVSEERFTPILLGVTPPEPPRGASLDVEALRPYVLFVGTSDRRKGLDVLCGAMEIVQGERPDLRLILAGERSDHVPGLERLHGDALGYVDDTTLAELYRNAAVFAFPSRYEGFGLPVLEAMKYGTPVVTSNAASIPEAAGDAGLYVPVDDARALAAAILKVVSEPNVASDLRERGVRRATEMTWQKTAEATLDVLERAAAR
jgi:glycosyltransferase involved in cell wall biosynthesis